MKAHYRLSILGLLSCLCATPLVAQSATTPATTGLPAASRQYESRAQLDSAAKVAESRGRTSEAWLLRSRLQRGDFQEGDRMAVLLENGTRIDTMSVRTGNVLQFIGMADLSLEGVLRSELSDTVRAHLAKYLVNPGVRVTPLLPIAVLGSVGAPGYYYTPADVVLRDLLMKAGGFQAGDVRRTIIKRGGETIWDAAAVRIALANGLSIDRLHLRAGDEVFVPKPRTITPMTILSAVSATTTLYWVLFRNRTR